MLTCMLEWECIQEAIRKSSKPPSGDLSEAISAAELLVRTCIRSRSIVSFVLLFETSVYATSRCHSLTEMIAGLVPVGSKPRKNVSFWERHPGSVTSRQTPSVPYQMFCLGAAGKETSVNIAADAAAGCLSVAGAGPIVICAIALGNSGAGLKPGDKTGQALTQRNPASYNTALGPPKGV